MSAPTDYTDGSWIAMTMGQFCQIIIDGGPTDAVLFRVVADRRIPGNDKSFMRHMDLLLVPDGSIGEGIETTNAAVHKVLAGLLEKGLLK
jgi:hypothetical protein